MKSSDVALRFVQEINAHDIEGLVELMTPSHTFIDSLGGKSTRPGIEEGWRRYFEMVPDYWVRVDRTFSDGDIAILVGKAGGTYTSKAGVTRPENRWETPAVWIARIEERKVAEWRVYSDNEPFRDKMRESEKRTNR
jgi:ketosteroid isomerase-like protein